MLVEGFDPAKAFTARRSVCAPPPPSVKSRGSVDEGSTSQNDPFQKTTGNRGKSDRAGDLSRTILGSDNGDDPYGSTEAANITTAPTMDRRDQWAMRTGNAEHHGVVGHMKSLPRVEEKSRSPDYPDFRERGGVDAMEIGGGAKVDDRWRTNGGRRRAFGFPTSITRQTRADAGFHTFPDDASENSEGGYDDGGLPFGESSSNDSRAPNGWDDTGGAFHNEHGGDGVDDDDEDDDDTLTEYGDDEDAGNEGKNSANDDLGHGIDDARPSTWSVPLLSISPPSTDSGTRTREDFTEIIDRSDRGADNNTVADSTVTGRIRSRNETSPQARTESVSQGGETKEGYSETRSPPRSILSAMFSAWGNSGA